jgi:gas vesicle protein
VLELTLSLFSFEIKENGLENYQTSFFYWKLLDFLEISLINENNRVTNNINLFLEELNNSQTEELSVFNENNEFNKLLDKNQTVIQQKDEKYLHNFVRLKRYIICKRLNILSIIEILKKTSYDKEFDFTKGIIENGKMISEKFDQVINSIYEVGRNINDSIGILSSEINSSIQQLNNDINSELKNIGSSIKFNNLLTGISTYQLYKINKNTK